MPGNNLCAVLSRNGQVYLWPWQEDGDGALVTAVADKDIVDISCGDDYGFVFLTKKCSQCSRSRLIDIFWLTGWL